MCDTTRFDGIRNVLIRGKVGVTLIEDKMREARLISFGNIKKRSMDATVRKCQKIDISRYRLRKSWNDVIRHNLKTLGLMDDMAQYRKLWKSKIKVADFGQLDICPFLGS